jgi:5-hydroxyisourate hydrolase
MTLSTHVLDTMHGTPAAGVKFRLLHGALPLFEGATDDDGRCPALKALVLHAGAYRLEFHVAAYFRQRGINLPDPPFLDVVSIDFGMSGDGHYHVPLLVSPFAYSTYRGS